MPRNMKPPERAENTGATLKRVIRYVLANYKIHYLIVVICIVLSALISLVSTLFMRTLIDDYIMPLLSQSVPDYAPLAQAMLRIAGILIAGVIATMVFNWIMITVSQGTMKRLRIELFTHMEGLPISYFDTHAHGDIMSVYTNDVDTLRQVISQTMPQFLNSSISLIGTFISMVVLSVPLTLVSILMVVVMLRVSMKLAGRSGGYFKQQQNDLGSVNGYKNFIGTMMSCFSIVSVWNEVFFSFGMSRLQEPNAAIAQIMKIHSE